MIRIGKMTDYGVVILSYFAKGELPAVHTARELALDTQLPLPTVSKILKILSRAELLESSRGATGGYRLARPAKAISVAEVIGAFEGPIAVTECGSGTSGICELEGHCPVQTHWGKINSVVRRALADLSLAEMVQTPLEMPRAHKEIASGKRT